MASLMPLPCAASGQVAHVTALLLLRLASGQEASIAIHEAAPPPAVEMYSESAESASSGDEGVGVRGKG